MIYALAFFIVLSVILAARLLYWKSECARGKAQYKFLHREYQKLEKHNHEMFLNVSTDAVLESEYIYEN